MQVYSASYSFEGFIECLARITVYISRGKTKASRAEEIRAGLSWKEAEACQRLLFLKLCQAFALAHVRHRTALPPTTLEVSPLMEHCLPHKLELPTRSCIVPSFLLKEETYLTQRGAGASVVVGVTG